MPITRILTVDPLTPDPAILAEAAAILKDGGLVAFPTETVYGLGANALDPKAVSRIFAAKGRPSTDPLIVHIAEVADLLKLDPSAPASAEILAKNFWPGPLTLVVTRPNRVAPNVSGGLLTIGVRLPAHPVARQLIRAAQIPVAAPSANLFSHTSPTEAKHVLDDLDGRVDLILDGGPCAIGVESTVVNLLSTPPEILRPGGISLEALRVFLPTIRMHRHTPAQDENPMMSPGMLSRHYAPHTPLQVISGSVPAIQKFLESLIREMIARNERVGLLLTDEIAEACAVCRSENSIVVRLGSGENLEIIAARLFAALRSIDQAGINRIIAIEPENLLERGGLGPAIHDRLLRASSGNLLELA